MRKLLLKQGRLTVAEVPSAGEPGDCEMRVRVLASALSPGTESAILAAGQENLENFRENLAKAVRLTQEKGLTALFQKIQERASKSYPLGYSTAGIVESCGAKVSGFAPGDLIASSGSQFAHHAEEILVSSRLSVKVPSSVSPQEAATVTLGAIALNAVRQAGVSIGETVAVIGLGVLGQLIAQIAQAAGAKVIGLDRAEPRLRFAQERGFVRHAVLNGEDAVKSIGEWTRGQGVRKIIIAAHAPGSDDPVNLAGRIAGRRALITVVGNVKSNLDRQVMYEKDLSLNIAVSYGPGRYDESYEAKGVDYPAAYVPWTAERNMTCYLDLLADRKITVAPLIQAAYPVAQAEEAYAQMTAHGAAAPLLTLLEYPNDKKEKPVTAASTNATAPKTGKKKLRLGVIGAGGFVATTHLPILRTLKDSWEIAWICNKHPENAARLGQQYRARPTANYQEILGDPSVDVVLIGARHNLHAPIAQEAIKSKKAVFVEKPLATTIEDLENLEKIFEKNPRPLHVGFNRRFSPLILRLKKELEKLPKPWVLNYRVAAEVLAPGHWILTEEGGGRVIGELCHMIDLVSYIFEPSTVSGGAWEPIGVEARSIAPAGHHITDHVAATLTYPQESIANITYSASRAKDLGKEYLEIITPEGRIRLDDFKTLEVSHGSRLAVEEAAPSSAKGFVEEWQLFGDYLLGRAKGAPISFGQAASVTKLTFFIDQLLRSRERGG